MTSIYLHIPYCKRKCTYCNFHFKISQRDKMKMIKSMQIEITQRKDYLKGQKVSSIYFGGGTPSILTTSDIKKLLKNIYQNHQINKDAEITIECNPEDLTVSKLSTYKKIGVNRLSIGVQSFDNTDLQFMNRSHNSEKAIQSIKLAKDLGFNNISIDLIYGLPNQTLKKWEKNLDIMFSLDIQHFSAYTLTVEKKTTLYHLVEKGKVKQLSEDNVINQFNLLQKKAKEQGFIHYEISNFGKEGRFSKHNSSYWKNKHYLGIGPSAHSYNGKHRRWNLSSNTNYISNIEKKSIYFKEEKLSLSEKYNEYIFTSLRTIWGVDVFIIKKRYGNNIKCHFLKEIIKWQVNKHVKCNSNIYTLTSKGKIVADSISSDLFIISS